LDVEPGSTREDGRSRASQPSSGHPPPDSVAAHLGKREGRIAAPAIRIAVVVPCYRVGRSILAVLASIGPEVWAIYVVDDACPERSAELVEANVDDPRVRVLRHAVNSGVGAATLTGMSKAVADGADILVKLDGDGQIDPALIPKLVRPLILARADYAKGNRFHELAGLGEMPTMRRLSNALASFASKISTGYWDIFDPANGFIALHASVFRMLPTDKIARGYFFESDMLFRAGLLRAVVEDVPMRARYRGETSSLRIGRQVLPFARGHARNLVKRIFYRYLLRDFNVGSLYLLLGAPLFFFGAAFGGWQWLVSSQSHVPATAGTVMLAGLPVIVGLQLLLSFIAFDLQSVPRTPIHRDLLD
jgi:glycosyltransferase involved in cell wall biosynthesis